MAFVQSTTVVLLLVFSALLQITEGYCSHGYGTCYSVWSMWYFWLSLVVLLVICCGAMGGYWRRRRMMQTMNQQTAITVHNPGFANQGFGGPPPQSVVMTPPPYTIATQGGATGAQLGNMDEKKGDFSLPPSYAEAVPESGPSAYPQQPAPYPQQPAPYPQQPAPYPQQPAPYPQQPAPYPQQPAPYPQQPVPYPTQAPPPQEPGAPTA